MVMENEIRLGDIMDKLTPSDRVVIYNAARQVVYRGYAANAVHGTLNPQRRIKKMGLGMETYRATEQMWDWEKTDSLPEQVPVEQFDVEAPERTDEEKRMLKKAAWYSNFMDKRKPPTALIGEPEEED